MRVPKVCGLVRDDFHKIHSGSKIGIGKHDLAVKPAISEIDLLRENSSIEIRKMGKFAGNECCPIAKMRSVKVQIIVENGFRKFYFVMEYTVAKTGGLFELSLAKICKSKTLAAVEVRNARKHCIFEYGIHIEFCTRSIDTIEKNRVAKVYIRMELCARKQNFMAKNIA